MKNGILETLIRGRNSHCGYFVLLNVRLSVKVYCDIYIILDKDAAKNKEQFTRLKEWHLRCVRNPDDFKVPRDKAKVLKKSYQLMNNFSKRLEEVIFGCNQSQHNNSNTLNAT